MKTTFFFLLTLCFTSLAFPQAVTEKQSIQNQEHQIRKKPSVYDIHVWSDPALPMGALEMYFGLDNSGLQIDHPEAAAAVEQLIHAMKLYDADKYDEAIEFCEKILSLPKRNDDLFEIKTRFLM